jgi:hypothetical protein
LSFEANRGQASEEVKFLSRGPGYFAFLGDSGASLSLWHGKKHATVRMEVLHGNRKPGIDGVEMQTGRTNYFFPDDLSRSLTGIPNYAKVRYRNVYPGIDLLYHGDQQRLEYDFILAPGADPNRIAVAFQDTGQITVDRNGDLVISTRVGEFRQLKPVAYQDVNGKRTAIDVAYLQHGSNAVAFRIGAYDKSTTLVIDPVLTFSTYAGGGGNEAGRGVAVDAFGYVYLAGSTNSFDFPAQHHGSFCRPFDDSDQQPCINPFVVKLDPGGTSFVYKSFFVVGDGGAHALAIDSAGNAYLTGNTDTGIDAATASSAFVAKIDPTGSQLLYYEKISVPLANPKNPLHNSGEAIVADGAGNAYVTGNYASAVFVIKLDATGNTVWSKGMESTSSLDSGTGLALDPAGSVYVAGYAGPDFPTTAGAFQTSCSSTTLCGFLAKIDGQSNSVIYSTFLSDANILGIAVAGTGNAYITGSTASAAFPTVNAIQPALPSCGSQGNCSHAFITEFNITGSGLVFSTYLGGSGSDSGQAITLDPSGNIYVAGYTSSADFPTADPVQPTLGAGTRNSGFVTKLNPSASAFLYSTYLGGSCCDSANAIAADAYGNIYVAGATSARNFPTVKALQTFIGGNGTGPDAASSYFSDAFLARISSGSSGGSARLVQANTVEGSGIGSISAPFRTNNTAGNLIIAFVRMSTIWQTVTVTDSAGNSYIDAVSQAQADDGHQIHIFYAANIQGGTNTVHATFSGANNHPWLAIYEYSGIVPTNPLDQVGHAQGNDSSPFTGLISTAHADELEFAAAGLPASYTGSAAAGSSYTLLAQDTGTSRATTEVAGLSIAGQYAGSFNLSSPTNWSAAVATFIVAAANIPSPTITTTDLRNGVQGLAYGDVLTVTNGKLPFTWSVVSGSLPAGLILNPNSGVISGTAGFPGTSNFTIQVTDANSQSDSRALSIMINANAPAPTVTTTSLPSGTQGQPYTATLKAAGGVPPYTWSLDLLPDPSGNYGELPPGLKLDPSTGTIFGAPAGGGSSFYVSVTDADYHSAISNQLTITVNSAAAAGISLVQSNAVMGSGVASISAAFASANTSGNTIIAFVRMSSSSQTVTIADSQGNAYTEAVSQLQSADGHQIHLFYAANIKSGANAVTSSFSSTNNHPWLAVYEYTGTLHVDQTAAAQGSGTAANAGPTAATTSASELIFAGLGLPASSAASIGAGSGFTLLQQNPSGSPGANESAMVSATGSYAATFGLDASENWSAVIATFAAGSAPSPPASISRIQARAAEGSGVSSLSVPFAGANTAGNMIIAFVRMSTTYQTVTVTDTAGNIYSDAVSQVQTTDGSQAHIFYAPNIRGGANTVTVTFSGTNNHPFLAIYEYSGVTTLDSTAHARGSDANPNSGTTATASSPNELIFGGLGLPSSSGVSVTAGPSGWTLELQDTNQYGSRAATEDGIITNLPGPFDATFSLSSTANWAAIVASFKP